MKKVFVFNERIKLLRMDLKDAKLSCKNRSRRRSKQAKKSAIKLIRLDKINWINESIESV